MTIANRKEPILLFVGDIILFIVALWVALLVRYLSLPNTELFLEHLAPFSFLFGVSIVVFFIAGLYEKHTLLFRSKVPGLILQAMIANAVIAIAFFYFIPYFGITPKTNLFLYLAFASVFVFLWRVYGVSLVGTRKRERAILIGSGSEMYELRDEVNHNPRYSLTFISSVDLDEVEDIDFEREVINRVYSEHISSVVIDLRHEKVEPFLPRLYNLIFSNVQFIDKYKVYEDIFDRVPLSVLTYNWFLENISSRSHIVYDILKRAMDIGAALLLGALSLIIYPFVFIAVKLDDGGPIFIWQERMGQNNHPMRIVKLRTMSGSDSGEAVVDSQLQVTRVGAFLRKSRLDELPQLWNVLKGDISIIGPRPEFPELVRRYESEIPYYTIRHLIKPGLSGWAQIYHDEHPHHGLAVDETKLKLSYDLYYIKNRSLMLDIKIALRTIQTLISRTGR